MKSLKILLFITPLIMGMQFVLADESQVDRLNVEQSPKPRWWMDPSSRKLRDLNMTASEELIYKVKLEQKLDDPYISKADVYGQYWQSYVLSKPLSYPVDNVIIRAVRTEVFTESIFPKLIDDTKTITVGGYDGEIIVKKILGDKVNSSELKRRRLESAACKSGLDEERIDGCFVGINPNISQYYPETSSKLTYLRALSNISSIVDAKLNHACAASVYKKGVWVTASHCINMSYNLIVGNEIIPLKDLTILGCGAGCDVSFITAKTPDRAEMPDLVDNVKNIEWETDLFIPSMPVGTTLSLLFQSSDAYSQPDPAAVKRDFNKKIIWSPYGEGFCVALKQYPNGCVVHSCSTVAGFSGAPIYSYDKARDKIVLLGVHSGSDGNLNSCAKESSQFVNFARLITKNGAVK